ncbi:GNAT family N-acetyltransferase [Erwinia mallotivora]|uniref:GNAT family N-acetyltransferase n=1 Tax=Erwinia mallotivora TaxID=69222 RepID=UPI0035E5D5E1
MKIVMINAATLPVYRSELANLLLNTATSDATDGEQQRLSRQKAESYFHGLRAALSRGERKLWIARDEQGISGSVQLEICQKPEGRNRAEIQQLLVHDRARRLGTGRKLMAALEQEAVNLQRGLLYLDTPAGGAAEAFYRAQGYRCLGELPDFSCSPEGYSHAAVIYYKRLMAANQVIRMIAS